MSTVTGECWCHGIVISGPAGTVAQPKPYWHTDFWTGKRVRCVAVSEQPGWMPHDVPLQWPSWAERLTDQPTVIAEEGGNPVD